MFLQYDHRQLAGEMEIFFLEERIGAGFPVWLPNGFALREALSVFVRSCEAARGYRRVLSPPLAKGGLYERSGHLEVFRECMFSPMAEGEEELFLRPMNCPHHHLIFGHRARSFRELPLRIAEEGQVFRREPRGSLCGISRARALCQNDAHIYLAPEQAPEELDRVLELHLHVYRSLGLRNLRFRLSLRARDQPDSFPGSDQDWSKAEKELREAMARAGLSWFEAEGEAAFYGPKIDVQARIGQREESIASVQLDFQSGSRFGLWFSDRAGERRVPWVIHRAPLGSFERCAALLLEQYQGLLPAWLSPVQLLLLPVQEAQRALAHQLAGEAARAGFRVLVNDGAGNLSARLKESRKQRPFARLVIGEREVMEGAAVLALRNEAVPFHLCNLRDVLKAALPPAPGAG